jgi:hypothetical protein
MTRRFASTEMDILGGFTRRQADVSVMCPHDCQGTFSTDRESELGSKSMKDKIEVSAVVT